MGQGCYSYLVTFTVIPFFLFIYVFLFLPILRRNDLVFQ